METRIQELEEELIEKTLLQKNKAEYVSVGMQKDDTELSILMKEAMLLKKERDYYMSEYRKGIE